MSISYCKNVDLITIESIIGSISKKPKCALWFEPVDHTFNTDDLVRICFVFEPMRCTFLVARDFIGTNARLSASSFLADLINGEDVVDGSLDNPLFNRTTRLIGGWLSSPSNEILDKIVHADNLSRLKEFVIIAFLPNDRLKLKSWWQTAMGPFWLWLNSDHIASSPEPSLRSEAVWLSYIDMAIDLGGVAVLEWIDSDNRRGFAAFGDAATINSIAERIVTWSDFLETPGIVKKLLKRGFSFQLLG